MELGQILSWIVVAIGLLGFYFAGKKKWWSWYINLFCQLPWFVYAFVTGQPAFLASAAVYSVIFGFNAIVWTKDHLYVKRMIKWEAEMKTQGIQNITPDDGMIIHNTKLDGSAAYSAFDVELIARVCHEANRILQHANDEEDLSYSWHLASDAQRKSAIEGVKKALDGESAVQLHESWVQQKFADGWVYGEHKDEGIKTHPCLVPYLQLPEGQRVKDHMFRAIVKAFKVDAQEKASAYIP
jgi:hypothetical protein